MINLLRSIRTKFTRKGLPVLNRRSNRLRLESLEPRAMLANSVDVIFVADTSGNMSYDWVARAIESLGSRLEEEADVTDVDFALVGFGGDQLPQPSRTEVWHFDYDPIEGDALLEGSPSAFTTGPLVDAHIAAAGARGADDVNFAELSIFQGSNEDGWAGIEAALSIYDDASVDRPDAISLVLVSNEGRNVDLSSFDNSSCRNQSIPSNGNCADELVAILQNGGGVSPTGQPRDLPPIVVNSVVTADENNLFLLSGSTNKIYGLDSKMQGGLRFTYEYAANSPNSVNDDQIATSLGGNYVPGSGSSISLVGNPQFATGFSDCTNDQNHGCTFHDYIDVAWGTGGAAWDFDVLSQTLQTSDPNDPSIPVTLEVTAPTDGFAQVVTQQIREQIFASQPAITVDLIDAAIGSNDMQFDLNGDGSVTFDDIDYFVEEVMGTHHGDLDLDGNVAFADFLILSANFGKTDATYSEGDIDGDGVVAFADFLILSQNFGLGGP